MTSRWEIVSGLIGAISILLIAGALLIRGLQRSDDPAKLLFKWIFTVILMLGAVYILRSGLRGGSIAGAAAMFGVYLAFVVPCILILWGRSIGAIVARPLTSLFDGGTEEPEQKPLYSIAQSKRAKGQPVEAMREIRTQLEKFPGDYTASMLLAAIQAEDLNDLPGAELTVERLLGRKEKLPPAEVASALQTLSDWQLKYGQDPEAARLTLERIIDLLPDSPFAHTALQRIAHLSKVDELVQGMSPDRVKVPERERNIGLRRGYTDPIPVELDAQSQAAEYVKQLEAHPHDTETREKLAMLYAEKFERLDLAVDQLEQLIAIPNESPRRIVNWLNLMASLHTRFGNDWVSAEQCLRRIVELFPGSAAAEMAQTRMAYLKLELKGNEKSQAKKLGSYEKDLGLKKKI